MAATYDGSIRINSKIDTAGVETGVSKITSGLKKFAGMVGVAFSITAVVNWAKAAKEAWSAQTTAETKLATVMRKRTNATNEQIQSILDLTAAQQKMGVIGDEVQLAGAQQLATFTTTTDQLNDLIPAMNNLVAQQYGYNATTESAVGVANMMGRALEGQTGALTRVGISMSDAEKKTIQYGDKTQRAATLAKIITNNVGEMNQALANTPLGRQKQLSNVMGDVNEQFGKAITEIGTIFIPVLKGLATWLGYIASLANLMAQSIANLFGAQSTGYDSVASSAAGASNSVDGLTNSTEDGTAATKKSNKATKEASNNLADFDKINTLSKDTASTGTTPSTPASATTPAISTDDLQSKIKASMDSIYAMLAASAGLLVLGAILTFSGHPLIGIGLMVAGAVGLAATVTANWDTIKALLQEPLNAAIGIFTGLALLVLGAILAFSGAALGLGIGLMMVGAVTLGTTIAANWDTIKEFLTSPIGAVVGLFAGIALLALGAIFAFGGASLPLGIALMLAGAGTLAAEIGLNWNAVTTALTSPIGTVVGLFAGLALLALGAILTFSGVALALGIPLMVVGAATLAAEASLNWDSVKSALQGPIGKIIALVGAAFLVLGAVLAFSGVALPLGIALMAIGAASLAAVAALNWETIKTALQGPIGEVVAAVSIAFLAIGAILAFSGVGLPLGIALMAVGAAGLTAVVALNWDTIITALQGPIGLVTALVGVSLLALGAILCFSGVGIPLGIGLLAAGGVSLAAAIAPNWDYIPDKLKGIWKSIEDGTKSFINWMVSGIEWMVNKVISGINWMIDQLNKVSFHVPDWVPKIGGKHFGLDISPLSDVSLPRLAQGAVIPPNRQFMAVLGDQTSGTNIETPLDTMVEAFKAALSESGAQSNVPQSINIIASGDDAGLIKYIKFSLDKETARVGTKLVVGGGRY
jgi:hypothetical protein